MAGWVQQYQEELGATGLQLNRVVITPNSTAAAEAIYDHLLEPRINKRSFADPIMVDLSDDRTQVIVKSWSMEIAQSYLKNQGFGDFQIDR